MNPQIPPGGRISGARLAALLGNWRRSGSRQGAADLAAAVELHVSDGQLPPGTRLPAEREFAEAFGVSRTLVGGALDRLRENGLIDSRRGAGTWVTAGAGNRPPESLPHRDDLINLSRAAPPAVPDLLPAIDAARNHLDADLLGGGYTDAGLPVLRERIAARYRARGLPTTPRQIMITNGAHHAFGLVLRMLTGPGDRVLVEHPSYPAALETVRAARAVPVPVVVDAGPDQAQGWDLDAIEAALRQTSPRLGYFIVDFHNPTGLRMDAAQRDRLGRALARNRTPFLVDETLVELDLDGDPLQGPPPLAAFAGDWAITVGSAAKSHWGGLRLGWIRASDEVLARLSSARYALDLGSPVLEQLVLAELLAEPEDLLRKRRAEMRTLRDTLAHAVRAHCPDWSFRTPAGGQSIWCRLPEPMSTRLAIAAADHGVQLAPGSRFGVNGGLERWTRLPFTQSGQRLEEAMRRLARAADSVRGPVTTGGLDTVVT
jgi:DNA-binding transcriptional MocR family regulator